MEDTTANTAPETDNLNAEDVSTDNPGAEGSPEHAPKPFRAWELPEPAAEPEPNQVPYSRFAEVNNDRKALQAQLSEYESRLVQLQERQEVLDKIQDPDEINIDDYDDPKEYLKARDAAIKAAAVKEVEERWIAREAEKVRAQQLQEIDRNYRSNVEAAVKRNPEIKQAVGFLDKYGEHLHPAVAFELLRDPNIGELALAITTDPKLLQAVFKGDPSSVVRHLQRMSGRLDAQREYEAESQGSVADQDSTVLPRASFDPRRALADSVPTQLRSAPVTRAKDPGKMSNAEYKAWRARGGGK